MGNFAEFSYARAHVQSEYKSPRSRTNSRQFWRKVSLQICRCSSSSHAHTRTSVPKNPGKSTQAKGCLNKHATDRHPRAGRVTQRLVRTSGRTRGWPGLSFWSRQLSIPSRDEGGGNLSPPSAGTNCPAKFMPISQSISVSSSTHGRI